MEILNRLITSTLPHYLTNLPIPKSVLGLIQLSGICFTKISGYLKKNECSIPRFESMSHVTNVTCHM